MPAGNSQNVNFRVHLACFLQEMDFDRFYDITWKSTADELKIGVFTGVKYQLYSTVACNPKTDISLLGTGSVQASRQKPPIHLFLLHSFLGLKWVSVFKESEKKIDRGFDTCKLS